MILKAKAAYQFWFVIFNDFPKSYRYSLGAKIDGYFLELLEFIFVSLYLPPEQKIVKLNYAISKLDGIKFFLQIAWENKCVPNEKYAGLSEKLNEVGRIIGGWKKGLQTKTPPR